MLLQMNNTLRTLISLPLTNPGRPVYANPGLITPNAGVSSAINTMKIKPKYNINFSRLMSSCARATMKTLNGNYEINVIYVVPAPCLTKPLRKKRDSSAMPVVFLCFVCE